MKLEKVLRLLVVLAIALAMALPAVRVAQAAPPGGATTTYWVNDPRDAPDANPGDNICDTGSGALTTGRLPCTLRAAIQEANASAGAQIVAFEFCGEDFASNGDVAGSYRISPTTPLPALTDGLTYFNGYTQGYPSTTLGYDDPNIVGNCTTARIASPNTNNFSAALNTVLAVEIDGSACVSPAPTNGTGGTTAVSGGIVPSGSIIPWASGGTVGACSGFTVTSDRNVFAGLNIRAWRNAGILIMPMSWSDTDPQKPDENSVWGDFIGTNVEGSVTLANRFGVAIIGGAHSNYVGDTTAIPYWGTGDARWVEEPTNNERNLISGNDNPHFIYGYNCTEGGGLTNFRDDGAGIFMGVDPCIRQDGSSQASIFTGGALDNHVRNSYIGTDYQGTTAVPNSSGVWLNYDAGADTLDTGITYLPGNHIGGCVAFPFTSGESATCEPQTEDSQQDPNLISGNRRLTTGGALQTLGGHGIWLNGLTSVSAHKLGDFDVSYNEIGGNFIGTNATGIAKLPNYGNGVYVLANQTVVGTDGPDHNEIGATTEYLPGTFPYVSPYTNFSYRYGNLISGNGNVDDQDNTFGRWDNGVEMRGTGAEYNRVGYGNTIGLNSQGHKTPGDMGNGENGVFIWFGAQYNFVHNNSATNISVAYDPGGSGDEAQSTFGAISDNGDFLTAQGRHGIRISNSAQFNRVFRNCIGGNANDCGGENFGNHWAGVHIDGDAVHNWIGLYDWTGITDPGVDQRNWIHHNGTDGVSVIDANTRGNVIRFNSIWRNGDPGGVVGDGNLGIDLLNDNDTANDGTDSDLGPNYTQNYPGNRSMSSSWLISFTQPSGCLATTCRTDVYATLISESDWTNPPSYADPQLTNNGEGRYWLTSVTGNATNLDISAQIASAFGGVPADQVCISLTTTRQQGTGGSPSTALRNTSEFSPCMGFTPTAVTLSNVTAHSNIPWAGMAVVAALAIGGTGVFVLRRKKGQ